MENLGGKEKETFLTLLWEHKTVPKWTNWKVFFMLNKISEKYNKNNVGLFI